MEKSIKNIWDESFISEKSLIAPKVNNLYNQKSKSIIHRIRRIYEFDNKGLIPMAVLTFVFLTVISEVVIGAYSALLILGLYFFNKKLLSRFKTLDIKSDTLTYLKEYRSITVSITKATKKLFVFILPLAVLSIFVIAFFMKEQSFLSKYISEDMSFLQAFSIGLIIAVIISIICNAVYAISTQLVYGTLFSKLDDIITEMETLKN
ncbi:hypothetical protein SAMN04489761_3745 [Tenacibaculum sp. MAR_2009_124]|uniref:hypothetical protein n=1 Tax=Tenacibaculum sp. MAR_2009_124 TaxID=1250059 RepID=UPI0008995C7A|nr:hypothetical protein [Tenacibaculum sp. MAR_2009_124]SEC84304.1 hypothetical protein SAMN04489761_3745 [Tenacibaculum sp. MAR_2009_124]